MNVSGRNLVSYIFSVESIFWNKKKKCKFTLFYSNKTLFSKYALLCIKVEKPTG